MATVGCAVESWAAVAASVGRAAARVGRATREAVWMAQVAWVGLAAEMAAVDTLA